MAEATAPESDWKQEPISSDNEFYRNSQLEYLESKLSNYELTTLIILENQCYDDSTSKENYDFNIQKLLKEFSKESEQKQTSEPLEQNQAPFVEPSPPQYSQLILTQEQKDSAIKKEIEAVRLNQQNEYNSQVKEYLNNNKMDSNTLKITPTTSTKTDIKKKETKKPATILERIISSATSSSKPSTSKSILSVYKPEKTYCDYRRRG